MADPLADPLIAIDPWLFNMSNCINNSFLTIGFGSLELFYFFSSSNLPEDNYKFLGLKLETTDLYWFLAKFALNWSAEELHEFTLLPATLSLPNSSTQFFFYKPDLPSLKNGLLPL